MGGLGRRPLTPVRKLQPLDRVGANLRIPLSNIGPLGVGSEVEEDSGSALISPFGEKNVIAFVKICNWWRFD
jgi:hypothetical protein